MASSVDELPDRCRNPPLRLLQFHHVANRPDVQRNVTVDLDLAGTFLGVIQGVHLDGLDVEDVVLERLGCDPCLGIPHGVLGLVELGLWVVGALLDHLELVQDGLTDLGLCAPRLVVAVDANDDGLARNGPLMAVNVFDVHGDRKRAQWVETTEVTVAQEASQAINEEVTADVGNGKSHANNQLR